MSFLDEVYKRYLAREKQELLRYQEETLIRLWDGDWNLVSTIQGDYEHSFKFINLDAGDASVVLPVDHWVARMMMDPFEWPTKSMYLTFDKDGARWSGRIETARVDVDYTGDRVVELLATHDYKKMKELLAWANPFLPASVQFPKSWYLFGPSRWCVAATVFCNLLRMNNSLWELPDDPLDLAQWFDLDMSNWRMAIKPVDFGSDSSPTAFVSSRFKVMHDCIKPVCEDAQLVIECRRFLEGDEQPIPGKVLRHGCLVFEVKDKAGYNQETAFGGSLATGFTRAIRRIQSDGLTEHLDYVPRVEQPDEYYQEGFEGTVPTAPWVVLEHSEYSGINSTEFTYSPPGPSYFVTGGSSMPGVNEAIKASIIGFGGFLGSFLGFQTQIGSTAEALLEPLYSDVFAAFNAQKDHDRIESQGWDYPFEQWADGSDKAFTLSALGALRKARHESRERFSVSVEMENGCPYWIGPEGYGDFFIGDRVGVHALGMSPEQLMVEQVEELEYRRSSDENGWSISIGKPEFTSGIDYLTERFETATAGLKELGVW